MTPLRAFGLLLILASLGCKMPIVPPSDNASATIVEQRRNAMPRSSIGNVPLRAGLDHRARQIETSLGIE